MENTFEHQLTEEQISSIWLSLVSLQNRVKQLEIKDAWREYENQKYPMTK